MSNQTIHLPTIAISVILGLTSGGLSGYLATESFLEEQPKIKVVDLLKLTKAQMKQVEDQVSDFQGELNRETIELLGQKAAADMLRAIANQGTNNFILSKQQVIFSPGDNEITELIASGLGLDGIKNNDMANRLDILQENNGDMSNE